VNSDRQMQNMLFEGFVAKLAQMASDGTAPDKGAEFLFENLPDEVFSMLQLPNWWAIVIAKAPSLKPYEAWFAAVKSDLDRIIAEEHENPEVDSEK
jgi:hypothetical protein